MNNSSDVYYVWLKDDAMEPHINHGDECCLSCLHFSTIGDAVDAIREETFGFNKEDAKDFVLMRHETYRLPNPFKTDAKENNVIVSDNEITYNGFNEVINKKIVICEARDDQCSFTSKCTNHTSAGDFRYEHGLTPAIYGLDEERKVLKCLLAEKGNTSDKDIYHYGEFKTYEQIKENLNGFLVWGKEVIYPSPNAFDENTRL